MTEQPTFGPKNIGEGEVGDPAVLRPTEKAPEDAPRDTSTLPEAWGNGTVAEVNQAEHGTLPGDGVRIQPAGTIESPELKPGDIGYTENTGNDSVITNQ